MALDPITMAALTGFAGAAGRGLGAQLVDDVDQEDEITNLLRQIQPANLSSQLPTEFNTAIPIGRGVTAASNILGGLG